MPRAVVTPELTEILRSIRLQNKIQAKLLAEHIGKSPAYISKLESGNIQTIDTRELYMILQYISGGEENTAQLAERIYSTLKVRYSAKEIEDQLWFVNYDTVERTLPIPESLIAEINALIQDVGISLRQLNQRINANEALSPEEIEDERIPFNHWYHKTRNDRAAQSIKIKLPESTMNAILECKIDACPYVFVYCILYYVLKVKYYGDVVQISDEENSSLIDETVRILNLHKFYSITEKEAVTAEMESKEEVLERLSSFDRDNIEILNDILSGFQFASEYNIKSTNGQLKSFSENMHWDLGFMLRIISMNFRDLERTSVSNKKNLIAEIEELIKKYAEIPDQQNIIESY